MKNKTSNLSGLMGTYRVRRSTKSSRIALYVAIPVVALLFASPYIVTSGIQQSLVQLFILIILGTMWNLLAGYAGMVSIGQQAFIGLGAYGLVYSANALGINPFLAIFVGIIVAGIISIPISFLAFRLSGGYFSIGTWVIAEVIMQIISRTDALGGGIGMTLAGMGDLSPSRRIAYVYWLALAAVIVIIAVTYSLMRSRLGAGFTAIRDDSVAAASLGVPVMRSKRVVYVFAAMGCGLAGGLISISTLQVQPESIFSVNYSAYMIFIVVIGGIGTIEGPIVGAIVFFALQQALAPLGPWYLIILGVIGVTIALYTPGGLWGFIDKKSGVTLFPVGYRLQNISDLGKVEKVHKRSESKIAK